MKKWWSELRVVKTLFKLPSRIFIYPWKNRKIIHYFVEIFKGRTERMINDWSGNINDIAKISALQNVSAAGVLVYIFGRTNSPTMSLWEFKNRTIVQKSASFWLSVIQFFFETLDNREKARNQSASTNISLA